MVNGQCLTMRSLPQILKFQIIDTVEIPPRSEMIVPGEIRDMPHFTAGVVNNNGGPLCDGNILVAQSVLNPTLKVLAMCVVYRQPTSHPYANNEKTLSFNGRKATRRFTTSSKNWSQQQQLSDSMTVTNQSPSKLMPQPKDWEQYWCKTETQWRTLARVWQKLCRDTRILNGSF